MKNKMLIILGLSLLFPHSCTEDPAGNLTEVPQIQFITLLTGFEIIWGMDFLPDGDLIFGEKRGKLYRKTNESIIEITDFPVVLSTGQGGFLDIRVHPDYANNGWIYASYAATNSLGGGQLRLIRFKIVNNKVGSIENIFSTNGSNTWYGHYGSRIVFDNENNLFLSVGEGGKTSYGGPNTSNNNAQDPASSWGKIHRLRDDGGIPDDNPVLPGNTEPSSVFSYGHRNPQGLTRHPETGEIWGTEHGPKWGDEVNIITSDKFKSWKGSLLVSGLASQQLYRCVVENNRITEEEVLLSNSGRVRNVIQAPDGSILVSVENPGWIIQIIPE